MSLHIETRGEGDDLVLIHGWGMNGTVWSNVAEHLAARFRVTVLDLPGHGRSEYDESACRFEDWVRACLDAAPERAIWIGWSLGGQIAQRAAVVAPSRVRKLVLVASSPRFVQGDDWPFAVDQRTLELFSLALSKSPTQTLERFLSLQVNGDDQARQTLRLLRQDLAVLPSAHPDALSLGLGFLQSLDLRDQLSTIECPMLWLLGERDTLIPVEVGEILEALAPRADILILGGAAHAPFLSHPRESLRALTGFIESNND